MDTLGEFFEARHNKFASLATIIALVISLLSNLLDTLSHPVVRISSFGVLLLGALYIASAFVEIRLQKRQDEAFTRLGDALETTVKAQLDTALDAHSIKVSDHITPNISSTIRSLLTEVIPKELTDSDLHSYAAKRYGISYDLLEIECVVDKDGSASVRRTGKIKAAVEFDQIDTYLLVPERSPDGQIREIGKRELESRTPDFEVEIADEVTVGGKTTAAIAFDPSVAAGKEVTYWMSEQLPPGVIAVNLTTAELRRRKERIDYVNWNILRPTRKLVISVHLPEKIRIGTVNSRVRYVSADGLATKSLLRLHPDEQEKQKPVQRKVNGGQVIYTLEVDYPVTGLIYELYWTPKAVSRRNTSGADAD